MTPEHQRGHGAVYDGLNCGGIELARFRRTLAGLPVPRGVDGRITLAVDVSLWLRPDAATSAQRMSCHVYGPPGRPGRPRLAAAPPVGDRCHPGRRIGCHRGVRMLCTTQRVGQATVEP